jgi:CBS domain-containing protein
VDDIADFLGSHPPFDVMGTDDVARVAAVTEIESHPAGKAIFSQGAGPVEYLWVVRAGSVEIVHNGRVLDLLGPGEMFGHASMLSGLPTGFEARAGEDALCYRIPADIVRPLLARPDVLRFVARSIIDRAGEGEREPSVDPIQRHVATLIRTPPVLCRADEPIREAAKRMTAEGASAVLVRSGDTLGIVTDRDLRSRVVAAGVSPDAPVSAIMTAPAYAVTGDRLGGEVLLDMLERGVHHVPVLNASGEILGVVDDADLAAAEARKPFLLRRAIDQAATVDDLAALSAGLDEMTVALHDARVAAEHIAAVGSVVLDALTRRLIELAVAGADDRGGLGGPSPRAGTGPAVPFTWFALGSLARREAVPSSDIDSALGWHDGADDPAVRGYMTRVAEAVESGLRACGRQPDAHGATASHPLFARSMESWRAAARKLSEDPTREQAIIGVSVIVDSRPVWSANAGVPAADALWDAPLRDTRLRDTRGQPNLLRLLARLALSFRPPTGFLRDFVVEHSGERKGQLDIKHGGLIPIVDLARWAGMAAGVASASTAERLHAAEAGGTLESSQARALAEAFDFIFALRLDHQVEQLRRGEAPDDFIDPTTLNPLARSYLRSAFRAIASVQSGLANELSLGIRWG